MYAIICLLAMVLWLSKAPTADLESLNRDTSMSCHCLFSQLHTHNSCAHILRIKENDGATR